MDCLESGVGSLLASIGLTTLSSAHLSLRSAEAVRTIASKLPAKTQRLYFPGSSLFNQ
jgi:hypothetical protein